MNVYYISMIIQLVHTSKHKGHIKQDKFVFWEIGHVFIFMDLNNFIS